MAPFFAIIVAAASLLNSPACAQQIEDCYDVLATKQKAKCYLGDCGSNQVWRDSELLLTSWAEAMEVRAVRWDPTKDFNVNFLLGYPGTSPFDLVDLNLHFYEEKTCDSQYWNCETVYLPLDSRVTRVKVGYYVESEYTKVASMTVMQSNGDSDIVIGEGRGDRFDTFDFLNTQRLIGMESYLDSHPKIYKVELLRFNGSACPAAIQPEDI